MLLLDISFQTFVVHVHLKGIHMLVFGILTSENTYFSRSQPRVSPTVHEGTLGPMMEAWPTVAWVLLMTNVADLLKTVQSRDFSLTDIILLHPSSRSAFTATCNVFKRENICGNPIAF